MTASGITWKQLWIICGDKGETDMDKQEKVEFTMEGYQKVMDSLEDIPQEQRPAVMAGIAFALITA